MDKNIQNRSSFMQKINFWITLFLVIISIFAFLYGVVEAYTLKGVPVSFLEFLRLVWFYNIFHFIWSIVLLIVFIRRIRRKIIELKLIKTILSVVLSPITFLIILTAIFLLGLSSCTYN